MKAIITREDITGIYYTLPIFESNPRYYIEWQDIAVNGIIKKSNSSKKYEYRLILVPNGDGIWDQLRSYGRPDFTNREMYLINEGYFYLLDHPNIKEYEINLV